MREPCKRYLQAGDLAMTQKKGLSRNNILIAIFFIGHSLFSLPQQLNLVTKYTTLGWICTLIYICHNNIFYTGTPTGRPQILNHLIIEGLLFLQQKCRRSRFSYNVEKWVRTSQNPTTDYTIKLNNTLYLCLIVIISNLELYNDNICATMFSKTEYQMKIKFVKSCLYIIYSLIDHAKHMLVHCQKGLTKMPFVIK